MHLMQKAAENVLPTDEDLMRAYREGDLKSFEVLYSRHSGRVWAYLRRRLRDLDEVDDAFQCIFMKLHRSRDLYDPALPFLPWLFMICRNAVFDQLRKSRRTSEEIDWNVEVESVPAPEPQDAAPAVAGLEKLPTAQRAALQLRYSEELAFDEIARRLQTSPGNVRQLISRGIRRLRTLNQKRDPR